jgi:hypothetical protein
MKYTVGVKMSCKSRKKEKKTSEKKEEPEKK